jgi:hypothetical protein
MGLSLISNVGNGNNMKRIITLITFVLLQHSIAFDGFTYPQSYWMNQWSNNKLAENIGVYLKTGNPTDVDVMVEYDVGDSTLMRTVYFYQWDKGPYLHSQTEKVRDAVKPFIKSFEKLNDCICWVRNCNSPDTPAFDSKPGHISNLQLTFVDKESPDRENPNKKYFFSVDIYNTDSDTLVISVLSVLPIEMKNFPTSR